MSLTSLLNEPSVRDALRPLVTNPGLRPKPATVIPRRAIAPNRVGTAFDYALRFGLKARYPRAVENILAQRFVGSVHVRFGPPDRYEVLDEMCRHAVRTLRRAARCKRLTRAASRACFDLGAIDLIYRAGLDDDVFNAPSREQLDEVIALFNGVPWEAFRPRRSMHLNPEFRDGTSLLRGADADLLIDDGIIDIKTVFEQSLDVKYVRQLVGYALLAQTYGVTGRRGRPTIERLGIYFARACHLHWFRLSDCVEVGAQRKVLRALLQAAGVSKRWIDLDLWATDARQSELSQPSTKR